MKCPVCGKDVSIRDTKCPHCGSALPVLKAPPSHRPIVIMCWILGIMALCFGLYKGYYWIRDYSINRLYTRGANTPTVTQTVNSSGLACHNIVYYGKDGDSIFIPELRYAIVFNGGIARFELQDSAWFRGQNMAEADIAHVSLTPVLISSSGKQTLLPQMELDIDAPYAPLTVTSPADNGIVVYTSSYNVTLRVYPGSKVTINGEDISSYMDTGGTITLDISVKPIGDNDYTILVNTENHKETRRDIMIYRQQYDIEFELTSNIRYRTSTNTMTVSGIAETGASVAVDSEYVADSLVTDPATGEFSFVVRFTELGWNGVRFHLSKEDRQDAVISFSVYYVPSLSAYSAKAWKMDYQQLRLLYEQWVGRIFKCDGPIQDIFTDEEGQLYYVMNVSKEEGTQQLVILRNDSSVTNPSMGPAYTAYADVSGRYMYKNNYYPLLTCRYLDLAGVR